MPRRKQVSGKECEIELSRSKLWLPNTFSYMNTKIQLVSGCSVVLKKIGCTKIKSRYKSTLASPKYSRNHEEPSVFLTPQHTPTSVLSDDSSDSKEDPFYWLDTFDDLTQLLLGSLLTQQYALFSKTISAQNHNLETKHLVLITEVLGKLSCSELMNCLKITFENEPGYEVKKKLKSIILELMFNEVRKTEEYIKKCMHLISIADKYKLNLLKKMAILNPNIKKMPVSLLVVEFLLLKKSIEDAVNILSHKKVIIAFLRNNTVLNDEFYMYGVTLLHTFRQIYQMKLPLLAFKLAVINLTQNILPPGVEIWGSTALLTILDESECNVDNLRKLFKKLIKAKIAIPINLQRAILIELSRKNYKKINQLFLITPAYSCFTGCLPTMGPITCKLKVVVMKTWTKEEMRLAVNWLNDTIQAKKTKPDVKCQVSFLTDFLEKDVIDDGVDGVHAPISKRFFLNSQKNAKKRLRKIIESSELEIAFTFD